MKKNKLRYILLIIIIFLLSMLGYYLYNAFKINKKAISESSINETIENYEYILKSTDTIIYKENFQLLKELLKTDDFDENEYVQLISKLFIIDFYTLSNKISNTDIGGINFVYSGIIDNFKLKASNTIYKYVKSNIYGDRNQELPTVKNVLINDVKVVSYKYNDITDKDAYEVSLNIEYEKDLGYETSKALYFVHENKKLSLVEMR